MINSCTKYRCPNCMQDSETEWEFCPNCGFQRGAPPKESYHMAPGLLLNDRYLVGCVIGYGGFGITYAAWDNTLERKVAIKEYLPSDFATRVPGQTHVSVYDGERTEQFESGLLRFLEEAQRLAKCSDVPGVVRIFDSFSVNGTAYIAMEFLDGKTLKETLKELPDGKLPFEEAVKIILPVLGALKEVHQFGIIHRDISPDNIFLTVDGQVKLLDFGAARYATTSHSKSLSVILKPGYAPEEQYRSRGEQGPWSDVYATAATLYRMLTGTIPEEALERKANDTLKPPSKLGVSLPKNAENALMNALNVKIENRTQSAAEFEEALLGATDVVRVKEKLPVEFSKQWPVWLKISVAASGVLLLLALGLVVGGVIKLSPSGNLSDDQAKLINVPNVVNLTLEELKTRAEKEGSTFSWVIVNRETSRRAKKDRVMSQSPEAGQLIDQAAKLKIVVSDGPPVAMVSDVSYQPEKTAMQTLQLRGFEPRVFYEESATIAPGAVIRQSVATGEHEQGERIDLYVSTGSKNPPPPRQVVVPALEGLSFEDAAALLQKNGLYILKNGERNSDNIPAGQIMEQLLSPGQLAQSGDIVGVYTSLGNETIIMPDVCFKPLEDAIALLESMGLDYEVIYRAAPEVQVGNVIEQDHERGKNVDAGATIVLTVSAGAKVSVPSVVGKSFGAAKMQLQALGLKTRSSNGTTPAENAKVTLQSVPAGSKVSEGSLILLSTEKSAQQQGYPTATASEAPQNLLEGKVILPSRIANVPNVVGMELINALKLIDKEGLKVPVYHHGPYCKIDGQTPPAGTITAKGDQVTLHFRCRGNCEKWDPEDILSEYSGSYEDYWSNAMDTDANSGAVYDPDYG